MEKCLCEVNLASKSTLGLKAAELTGETAAKLESLQNRIYGLKAENDERLSREREKCSLPSDGAWMPWFIRIPMG